MSVYIRGSVVYQCKNLSAPRHLLTREMDANAGGFGDVSGVRVFCKCAQVDDPLLSYT